MPMPIEEARMHQILEEYGISIILILLGAAVIRVLCRLGTMI